MVREGKNLCFVDHGVTVDIPGMLCAYNDYRFIFYNSKYNQI